MLSLTAVSVIQPILRAFEPMPLDAQLGSLEENKTLVGWTGGLGMEVGFTPNWSAKVEYLYMDLGSRAYTITGVDNGLQASYFRLGVNYHF